MNDALELIRPAWPAPATVGAAFTTRAGGVSDGRWRGLNLAQHVGDAAAAVAENRARLGHALGFTRAPHWLEQVHGSDVVAIDEPAATRRADAAIARRAGHVCVVMVADCVPILLCDRLGSEVAAVHAGWRGLEARVIAHAVASCAAAARDLHAWIGPAIGVEAYQVGDALRERFMAGDEACAAAFQRRAGGWHLNLADLAERQLRAAGVTSISQSGICVFRDPARFYSHRRDGETGRMAALIWIKPSA